MKKNFVYAILSAIALSGAAGFAGCSSSDEIIDNPNYNPETNSVKTQFTISLPQNVANSTRQSAATVQAAQTVASFRGFDNMVLIPYASTATTGTAPNEETNVSGNRLTATSITLNPTSGSENTLPADGLTDATNNSYVYSDVNIPLGTSGFLFYGKAIDTGTDKFVNGALTATPTKLTGEKTGFGFALNVIKGSSDGKAEALLTYINSIAAAAPTTGEAWCESTNDGIKGLYDKFITMKAGSSTSVQAALEDLYESLKNNTDETSKAVCTAITASATYTAGNAENERLVLNSTVAGYPADIYLPDGAVGLSWDNTKTPAEASWVADNSAWNIGSAAAASPASTTVTALDKFVYPASLYYRADSPVMVSNSKQSTNYSAKTWTQILNLYTNGASVGPSTQSVALVEQIEYAVAQLKSTVTFAQAALNDRNGDAVTLGTDGTFEVTGVLIGGQKNVDWQFLPTSTSAIYTIYDKDIPADANATTGVDANVLTMYDDSGTPKPTSVVNYTLALENTANENVYIAIELKNNAKDFIGKDGLIAKGTKFYLVGKLDPSAATTKNLDQVFKQDYVTTANFTISANTDGTTDPTDATKTIYTSGLGAAYNVIPDLRTPLMELGLSVNLTWQAGNTFTVIL